MNIAIVYLTVFVGKYFTLKKNYIAVARIRTYTPRGVRSKLTLGEGGSGFQGHFFIKKGHLQVNSFMVAIQRNCF